VTATCHFHCGKNASICPKSGNLWPIPAGAFAGKPRKTALLVV